MHCAERFTLMSKYVVLALIVPVVVIGSLRRTSSADEPAKANKHKDIWMSFARKHMSAMTEPQLGKLAETDHIATVYRNDGKYHAVIRHSPSGGDFVELCQAMLFMSGIDVRRTWFEYRQ
jgi:hypothetical protein